MGSHYIRDHNAATNDEFERLSLGGQMLIRNGAAFFEGLADEEGTPLPSEGERLALRRAMARFLIDSGIASARGWV